jgi:hypothetical protein
MMEVDMMAIGFPSPGLRDERAWIVDMEGIKEAWGKR